MTDAKKRIAYKPIISYDDNAGANPTMMVVDDLLNPYHLLTNRIIDMDFPPLVREELEDSKDKNISVKKKISRNEKCPCGSGLKYKFCCGKNK